MVLFCGLFLSNIIVVLPLGNHGISLLVELILYLLIFTGYKSYNNNEEKWFVRFVHYFSALSKAKNRSKIALKNTAVAYCFCIIICISTAYSGFSLTLISASSVPMLRKYYSIDWPQQVMLSLLNGILPIGGMLGCLLLPYFVALTNRKYLTIYIEAAIISYCLLQLWYVG